MNSRLNTYVGMLCECDEPMLYCLGHDFVAGDNTKYQFHAVELLYPLYVASEDAPKKGKAVRDFVVEKFYIEEEDGVFVAHVKALFPDSPVAVWYKTSVLLWRQYIGKLKAMNHTNALALPSRMYFDWFAYHTARVCDDLRYEQFTNVTILSDIPYLAGRKSVRTDVFARIVRHRQTGVTMFRDEHGVLLGIGVIPKWKLTLEPFGVRETVRTVAVAVAFVPELRDVFVHDLRMQKVVAAALRENSATRVVFLDVDAFLNTEFEPECEPCEKNNFKKCVCVERNAYFESWSAVDQLCVLVLEEHSDLNGRLCESAVGLAGLLSPENIETRSFDDISSPQDMLGEAFEETLAAYAHSRYSRRFSHWTEVATRAEDGVLKRFTIKGPPPSYEEVNT